MRIFDLLNALAFSHLSGVFRLYMQLFYCLMVFATVRILHSFSFLLLHHLARKVHVLLLSAENRMERPNNEGKRRVVMCI